MFSFKLHAYRYIYIFWGAILNKIRHTRSSTLTLNRHLSLERNWRTSLVELREPLKLIQFHSLSFRATILPSRNKNRIVQKLND